MLMLATAGLKPCETASRSNSTTCTLCTTEADGYDATLNAPLCTTCAETRNTNENTAEGHNE